MCLDSCLSASGNEALLSLRARRRASIKPKKSSCPLRLKWRSGQLLFLGSMEDGAPIIGWEPDLNEGGTRHERVYTIEGRESLTEGSWGPTNAASRFFRVKVSMP